VINFAASALDKTVAIYSIKQKNTRCLKFEQDYEIYDLDWSVKNLLATVGKEKVVNVFEPKIHKGYTEQIVAHSMNIRSVHFSNSGNRLITASDDKSIKMWRLSHRNFISSFTGHTNWIRCARFSPNNKMIASCAEDKTLKIFDVGSGELIHSFKDEKGFGNQLCWHRDNNLIAVAQENSRVKIFDLKTRKLIQYYRIFDAGVNSLDFHESGNFMITGSSDGLTKILDLLEGRDIFTIKGHQDSVTAVKFSKNGEYFVTGSKDRHIMVWKSNICSLISASESDLSLDSPKIMEDKENRREEGTNTSVTIDARASENYLQDDSVDVWPFHYEEQADVKNNFIITLHGKIA